MFILIVLLVVITCILLFLHKLSTSIWNHRNRFVLLTVHQRPATCYIASIVIYQRSATHRTGRSRITFNPVTHANHRSCLDSRRPLNKQRWALSTALSILHHAKEHPSWPIQSITWLTPWQYETTEIYLQPISFCISFQIHSRNLLVSIITLLNAMLLSVLCARSNLMPFGCLSVLP